VIHQSADAICDYIPLRKSSRRLQLPYNPRHTAEQAVLIFNRNLFISCAKKKLRSAENFFCISFIPGALDFFISRIDRTTKPLF